MKRTAGISMLAIVLTLSTPVVQAQNVQYDVTFADMDGESYARLLELKELLEDALERRGAQHNPSEGWLFLVGLSEPNGENVAALSITTLHKLPENIVELGKREQAFYKRVSDQDPQEYPEEGKWVREYMSEEYMRQFTMIQGNYVEVVSMDDLQKKVEEIVDRFYERHVRQRED